MDLNHQINRLIEKGYVVVPVESFEKISQIKKTIASLLRSECSGLATHVNEEEILNNIHKYLPITSDTDANDLVIKIINKLKSGHKFSEVIYQSNKTLLTNIFGLDIHAQKNNNIVFQYPHSSRYSELHTDAPTNSMHDLVSWVPLVDCYETKSFYICDIETTTRLLREIKTNKNLKWENLREKCIEAAHHLEINYGQALYFWSGLLHGSVVNQSEESRWSLNCRFKSLYAPSGLHDSLVFYEILSTSPQTHFAFNYQGLYI